MTDGFDSMLARLSDPVKRREFLNWFRSRPPSIQALVRRFPLPCHMFLDGVEHYLLGYTEDDMLILSPINPAEDYEGAMAEKVYVCVDHLEAHG